jgi:hypothetical protein
MNIRYLPYRYIDKQKWDQCVSTAPNGSVYTLSVYLDHMSRHWDALVLGDYEWVFPLTWNRKWGIHYLCQPPLSASGGLIGKGPVTTGMVNAFLEAIPGKFKLWEFSLNRENLRSFAGFPLYERMNFLLSLDKPYRELQKQYRDNLNRNLLKAANTGLRYTSEVTPDEVINLAALQEYRKPAGIRGPAARHLENTVLNQFGILYQYLEKKNMAAVRGVRDDRGKLLASCVFLLSHQTAYYVLVGNHPDGKALGASPLLIDGFIREHAGEKLTLDFEGSDIPGLAFFYKGFGAAEDPYAAIRLNRLPVPLRWLKR